MRRTITLFTFLTLTGLFNISFAQDRHFSWTYESATLPKGAIDIEPWVTYFSGHENFYRRYESRLEFETGLTNRLQTSVYLNTSQEAKAVTDAEGHVTGLKESSGFSFSNEWKLKLLDSSVNPVGLGIYGEYEIASNEVELEFKLLLDKRTPRSIWAYNLVAGQEFEKEFDQEEGEIDTEKEFAIENDLAYMYTVKPNFGIGVEARNHNVFEGGELANSALFAGPTIFFSQKNFSAIVNVMPQLTSLKGGGLELDDHEKFAGRILLGISF